MEAEAMQPHDTYYYLMQPGRRKQPQKTVNADIYAPCIYL